MKKITLVFVILFIANELEAQFVGIGTKTPAARLHVVDSVNNLNRLLVQGPTVTCDESRVELVAGTNPFSFLQISKYAPGVLGTIFSIPRDNLSLIGTGGNGGALMLSSGNGTSPLLFAAGTEEQMRITADGHIGIGTSNPAFANKLHLHSNDPVSGGDVSIGITNTFTTDALNRGARFRMNNYNLNIANNETTGKMSFSTNFTERLVILPSGNIGINNNTPAYALDITSNSSKGVYINQAGNNVNGLEVQLPVSGNNNKGIFVSNPKNSSLPNNFSAGIHAISGSGSAIGFSPTINYGLIGECRNPDDGYGVLGISNSPSPLINTAGVVGLNYSIAASSYGVIGISSGSSGGGTVGYTSNATAGLMGYATFNSTGPTIKSVSDPGSAAIGLELENGALKVSGTNRTVFRHTCTIGNTGGNETIIPNSSFANNPNDLLIVTPYWDGVYLNAPLGVYFESISGTWRIFRQDLGFMPLNAKFNVMVVKQ